MKVEVILAVNEQTKRLKWTSGNRIPTFVMNGGNAASPVELIEPTEVQSPIVVHDLDYE